MWKLGRSRGIRDPQRVDSRYPPGEFHDHRLLSQFHRYLLVMQKETTEIIDYQTYNELLGGQGELGCTLLIEIDDPAQRQSLLREWPK